MPPKKGSKAPGKGGKRKPPGKRTTRAVGGKTPRGVGGGKGAGKTPHSARNAQKKAIQKPAPPPPTPDGVKARMASEKAFYVLAVELDREGKIKKDIKRKKIIESMEGDIGRVIIPYTLHEQILTGAGNVVEESPGKYLEAKEARVAGTARAWELAGGGFGKDDMDPPEQYRVQVFPAKSQTKGKIGNGWVWKIREERSRKERKVYVKRKKYPGYLICNLKWKNNVHHLIMGIKGVLGFLPIPLPRPKNPTPTQKEEIEAWHPTALETEEAAELLIQQSEMAKQKKENRVVVLPFKVGDRVKITDGAFKDVSGEVKAITGERDPSVTVEVVIFNVPVPVTIKHWHAVKEP